MPSLIVAPNSTKKLLSKSLAKVRKLLEISQKLEIDGIVHQIAYKKTTSFNGTVHSLAKLSYCLANGIDIEAIDTGTIWVRRTCNHPMCILPEHLEAGNPGARKRTEEQILARQERTASIQFEVIETKRVEEEERSPLTEKEIEAELLRQEQELIAEFSSKEATQL